MIKATHEAVMVDEVLENLVFKENGKYIDCTFGAGGHSSEILKKISDSGALISIDTGISASFCWKNRSILVKNTPPSKLESSIRNVCARGSCHLVSSADVSVTLTNVLASN